MCLVGSGDGMGVRRASGATAAPETWVALAGVAVRARVTEVRVLLGLADTASFLCWLFRRSFDLARDVLRGLRRTDPLFFFRDAAAFNCFPLFGL
jgi:hypothetical protein